MPTKRNRVLHTRSSVIPPARSIATWLPTLTRATRTLQLSALVSLLSGLVFAGNAHAATLTVTPDKEIYSLGEIITLTVTGSIVPTLESTPNIFVSLEFTYASFISSTADTALNPPPMFGSQTAWVVGGNQGTSIDDEARVFDRSNCTR